ncbi:MAG TPA: hypothetical protein VG962_14880 [Steroidobacteraceae bacterium]|nr:hypothetical protein [Steroidobacteraceae bacterium]
MKTKYLVLGAVLTLGTGLSQACGPDFPLMITKCRSECLNQVKSPGFALDVAGLGSGLEASPPASEYQIGPLEASEPEPKRTLLRVMRQQADGNAAYSAGAGLPEAERLYTAGAVEFNRVHHSTNGSYYSASSNNLTDNPELQKAADKGLSSAIGWFSKVLSLPEKEAEPRLLVATYMLARCHYLKTGESEERLATKYFKKVVALASSHHDDPLGLGNAALGELGRMALSNQQFKEAVNLYARQASAPNAAIAVQSLREVAWVLSSRDDVSHYIHDPLIQKLLVSYALSRIDHTCSEDCEDNYDYATALSVQDQHIVSIIAALKELSPKELLLPDRTAALAYANGDYELAAKAIQSIHTPYAEWIHAKLALHTGDLEAAADYFSKASKDFAIDKSAGWPDEFVSRLKAEHGVLLLARKDYVEALYQLSASKFTDDAYYVAERVLTVDELKQIVDQDSWGTKFRNLLARRLARDGRIHDAVQYYSNEVIENIAKEYENDLNAAKNGAKKADQAKGLYNAAKLEIFYGMALIGTERCPDFNEYDGSFGGSCDQGATADTYISDDESARVENNIAKPNNRFHYRDVAVNHLIAAADLMPKHSQVISAELCNGVNWLQSRGRSFNDERINILYQKYARDGRAEPWAKNFGKNCPEPDFTSIQ